MPHFTMNRNLSVNSVLGACLNFRKDVPEFVPEFMREEIEERGGVEVDVPEETGVMIEIVVLEASNTNPVVCKLGPDDIGKARIGYGAKLRLVDPLVPFTGKVIQAALDHFTMEGDLSTEAAPLTDVVAALWPAGVPGAELAGTRGHGRACETFPEEDLPLDAAGRTEALHAAFEKMVIEGTASDDHMPNVRDTSEAVGFKVTAAERDEAWESFKAGD